MEVKRKTPPPKSFEQRQRPQRVGSHRTGRGPESRGVSAWEVSFSRLFVCFLCYVLSFQRPNLWNTNFWLFSSFISRLRSRICYIWYLSVTSWHHWPWLTGSYCDPGISLFVCLSSWLWSTTGPVSTCTSRNKKSMEEWWQCLFSESMKRGVLLKPRAKGAGRSSSAVPHVFRGRRPAPHCPGENTPGGLGRELFLDWPQSGAEVPKAGDARHEEVENPEYINCLRWQ